jgi:tRNA-dihydrouridine synthase
MDAVTLHARSKAQGYSGKADWSHITRFKALFGGTVIGNGDVLSAADGLRMLAETGCDGVMVGRGAIGDPWLFTALDAAWRGLPPPPRPTGDTFFRAVVAHFDMFAEYLGDEGVAARMFRKHLCRYVRGLSGAVRLRRSLPEVTTRRALLRALDEVLTAQANAPAGAPPEPNDFADIEVPV